MNLEDATNEDIIQALTRALETVEGANLYTGGPYPITNRPLADPPTVIYIASDYETYERPYTLAMVGDMINAELGDRRQVEARTVWLPIVQEAAEAAFSFDGGTLSARKTWKGLIFRAGDYPDKGCEVTPENLRAIVKNFPAEGVPVMSEHDESLIGLAMDADGTRLVRVWTANGDTELHGEIETPGWLDYALRDIKKSVSVGLAMTKEALREISLVLNPRVADAAVFDQKVAIAFSSTPAFKKLQTAHPGPAKQIATLAHAQDPAPAREHGPKDTPMNFKEKIRKAVAILTPEQRAEIGLTDEELASDANFSAPVAPVKQDPRDLAFAKLRAEKEFDDLLHSAKVTPAMKDGFITLFTVALKADGEGQIAFSDTGDVKTGSAVEALLKTFGALKPQFHSNQAITVAPEDDANPYKLTPEGARAALGLKEAKN